jgi:hypothetical protein
MENVFNIVDGEVQDLAQSENNFEQLSQKFIVECAMPYYHKLFDILLKGERGFDSKVHLQNHALLHSHIVNLLALSAKGAS